MRAVLLILFILVCLKSSANGTSSSVPDLLLKCYRTNYTSTVLKPPLTIQLLSELVRKIEWEEKNVLDLRMFTTSLLHSVRFDGIQATPGISETAYVVPYRASGNQFYKYKLLVDYLTPGKPQLLPYDSLSTTELCLLHEIISNTVHVWERGNEGRTCPELGSTSMESGNKGLSRCPIEGGAVKTKWGTVSPGHLIAGTASALQETTVNFRSLLNIIQQDRKVSISNLYDSERSLTNISNAWVSTIVGDLAEVTVQQAFNQIKIGNEGIWNSTALPRIHYLHDEPYDMTKAELLGGIDGLIFADNVKDWLSVLSRTRFSQLLDMYYSSRGVAYDKSYRACDRGTKLAKLLDRNNLGQRTASVAKLLQEIGAANQYLDESSIEKYALETAKEFEKAAEVATARHSACQQDVKQLQPLEIIVILDETWSGYRAESLVGALSEALDVSFYGSTLGIINGQTGTWMTNITHSLVQLYSDINNNKDFWQTTLRLSNGLDAANKYLQNQTFTNCLPNSRVPRSTVIVIMAHSALLSKDDSDASKLAVNSMKALYPETRIAYITSQHNSKAYEELRKGYANDVAIVIDDIGNSEAVVTRIVKELAAVPGRLLDFYCNDSQLRMEDYITPDIGKVYEIHAEYVRRADISVQFKGYDYGEASICAYDAKKPEDKECKGLASNQEVYFDARKFCPVEYSCSVRFSVAVTESKFKCSEFDCRYPDQMRIDILTAWTRKSGSSTIRCSVCSLWLLLVSITSGFCKY